MALSNTSREALTQVMLQVTPFQEWAHLGCDPTGTGLRQVLGGAQVLLGLEGLPALEVRPGYG